MKSVVINASGGGADFGTKGNGLVEKNVSIEISKKIYDILNKIEETRNLSNEIFQYLLAFYNLIW